MTSTADNLTVRNISGYFVNDHMDRQPGGEPVEITKTHKRGSVDVEGTRKQIDGLLADASYYADPYGPDMLPDGLKASAQRVAKRLAAEGFGV